MEENSQPNVSKQEQVEVKDKKKFNYDKYYKLILIIPIIVLVLSLGYLFSFYSKTGDFINKDVSLSGGTTITLSGNLLQDNIQN